MRDLGFHISIQLSRQRISAQRLQVWQKSVKRHRVIDSARLHGKINTIGASHRRRNGTDEEPRVNDY